MRQQKNNQPLRNKAGHTELRWSLNNEFNNLLEDVTFPGDVKKALIHLLETGWQNLQVCEMEHMFKLLYLLTSMQNVQLETEMHRK